MLVIRREQITRLGALTFETYVERLTDRLLTERFAAARNRLLPAERSREPITSFVRESIARARSYGFECEGDITPFVAMEFAFDEEFKNSSLYEWVSGILRAVDESAEGRMDAVYELLPDEQRALCFDQ